MALITITRMLGSGGTDIARVVAKELDLEFYDDSRLEVEAARMGMNLVEIGGLDEKAPNLLWHLRSHRPQIYLDVVQAVIFEVARRGRGVILGHGSQMLLSDFRCALHVCIHASEEFRVRTVMKKQRLTRDAAEKRIHRADHEQRGFLRFAFNIDWNDPSSYDLMVNRDKLSDGLVAKLITGVAKSREIEECSQGAMDSMERMSLGQRVEAGILNAKFDLRDIHVEVPKRGTVRITGVVRENDTKDRLIQLVNGMAGVSKVEDNVAVVSLFVD